MSSTITKYNLLSDLPPVPDVGDNAFVEETSKLYVSLDLSTITSNSFEFYGNNSFLETDGFSSTFTNQSDPWTIEFWSYVTDNTDPQPIFSIQKNLDNPVYTFSDVTGTHTLSQTGLEAFNFSPYNNDYTSSIWFDNTPLSTTNSLSGFNYHDEFSVSFWTYPINNSYTLLDLTKTDEDKTTLKITNNTIVDNGVNISIGKTNSFGYLNWNHNLLSYDGFDYSLFSNDSSVSLSRSITDIDSNQELQITDFDVTSDQGFKCKVSFGTSPTDSTLFEFGEVNNYVKLSLTNNGTVLEFRANSLSTPLVITTTNFPKDNNKHIVSWDIRINPGRIRLWIDDDLKGEATTSSGPLESNIWAGPNVHSRSLPVTSGQIYKVYTQRFSVNASSYQFRLYPSDYRWNDIKVVDTGQSYDLNGDKVYYFEFRPDGFRQNTYNPVFPSLFDTTSYTLRHPDAFYGPRMTHSARSRTSFYTAHWQLKSNDIFSVFVSEVTGNVFIYKNGSGSIYRSFSFPTHTDTGGNTQSFFGWHARYNDTSFRVIHAPSDWTYGPTHTSFLSTSVQNLLYGSSSPIGAYGFSYENGIASDSFSGSLISKLRTYPQTFGSLSLSSFNIGSTYNLSGSTDNSYTGYIKDFEITDSLNLSNIIPTSPVSSSSSTKFLLNSSTNQEILLDYSTDGQIRKKDTDLISVRDSNQVSNWTHTALVYNGTDLNAYKDGILATTINNFNLHGSSLSEGDFNIGTTAVRNINNATYDKKYYTGFMKEFILHDSAYYTDSSFNLRSGNYAGSNEILLTATENNVPNDGTTFVKNGTIEVEPFSPYTADDLGWIENGSIIQSNRTVDIVTIGGADFINIDVDSEAPAQSFLVTLNATDQSNNSINWSIDEWQTAHFTQIKQNNNKILIEPLNIDSNYNEHRLLDLTIEGLLSNGSIPVNPQNNLYDHSNTRLSFTYTNYAMISNMNSSIILNNKFAIDVADSADIASFSGIAARPFKQPIDMFIDSGLDIQVFDSPGALP